MASQAHNPSAYQPQQRMHNTQAYTLPHADVTTLQFELNATRDQLRTEISRRVYVEAEKHSMSIAHRNALATVDQCNQQLQNRTMERQRLLDENARLLKVVQEKARGIEDLEQTIYYLCDVQGAAARATSAPQTSPTCSCPSTPVLASNSQDQSPAVSQTHQPALSNVAPQLRGLRLPTPEALRP